MASVLERMPARSSLRLLWVLWASYFVFGLVLNVIGVIIPILIQQNHLSLFTGGLVAFATYIPFGICSIPSGLVADHIGARPVVVTGVLLMTVGCGAIAFTNSCRGHLAFLVCDWGRHRAFADSRQSIGCASRSCRELSPESHTYNRLLWNRSVCRSHRPECNPVSWGTLAGFMGITRSCARGYCCALCWQGFRNQRIWPPSRFGCVSLPGFLKVRSRSSTFFAIFFYVGAEVGTASWIVKFLQQVHGMSVVRSGCLSDHALSCLVPAIPIATVSLFWGLQGVGRLSSGPWGRMG